MITLLLSVALAAGLHAGIPVDHPALRSPSFLTPEIGWMAEVSGGWARIYVGRTEADAVEWLERARVGLVIAPSRLEKIGDEAWGDGQQLVLFRDGNVCVNVRVSAGALVHAQTLHAAIVTGPAWPAAPTFRSDTDGLHIVAGDAVMVQVEGSVLAPGSGWVVDAEPRRIVVWDRYGRPVVWAR